MADSLSGIDLFVTVVEAGSFSLAAERLDITRSAVGKGIVRLEQRLGVQLFHRTSRTQSLTDEGVLFFRHCLRALEEVRAGEAALESGRWVVQGRLRISMPVLFGHLYIAPILLELARVHSGLTLDLSFSDRTVDLVEEGFDLVVRNGTIPQTNELATRQLGVHGMTFCASPAYLQGHGMPTCLEELCDHQAIAYTSKGKIFDWQVQVKDKLQVVRPNARLQMDDMRAVADAAIAGFGIAWIPTWLAQGHIKQGELLEVLPQEQGVVYAISAIWPHTPHLPMKTKIVVEELAQKLPERLATLA